MQKNISIVTGSRAEFGLLKNLILKCQNDTSININLVATGAHLLNHYGFTIKEIKENGIQVNKEIDINLKDDSHIGIAKSTAIGIEKFSIYFDQFKPQLLVVLGDRYEILSVVIAAFLNNIPIAHIHGGEITHGSIDDSIRHSITKFSHLHFVATDEYRKRVIQLGENPKNVFNVGGLGIDLIDKIKLLSKNDLQKELNILFKKKVFLITVHPETISSQGDTKCIDEIVLALNNFKNTTVIFTKPNADRGNRKISNVIDKIVNSQEDFHCFESLGHLRYLSLIQHADLVLGNSSSGLLEVPYFRKPTINVGNRQSGRIEAKSVISCEANSQEITSAIKRTYTNEFKKILSEFENPYGNPGASDKIFNLIKEIELTDIFKKKFFDVEFNFNLDC